MLFTERPVRAEIFASEPHFRLVTTDLSGNNTNSGFAAWLNSRFEIRFLTTRTQDSQNAILQPSSKRQRL